MKIIEQLKNWLAKIRDKKCPACNGSGKSPASIKVEFEDPPDCRLCYKKDRRGRWWWRAIEDGGKILACSSRGHLNIHECTASATHVLDMSRIHTVKGLPDGR